MTPELKWVKKWRSEISQFRVTSFVKAISEPQTLFKVLKASNTAGAQKCRTLQFHILTQDLLKTVLFKELQIKPCGDLKSGRIWILNDRKEVCFQMVQILNELWNLKAQPFETNQNGSHFVFAIWNPYCTYVSFDLRSIQ